MKISELIWPIYAKFYDTINNFPLYLDLLDQVILELNLSKEDSLLNAGCGTGNLEKRINKNCFIESIDNSNSMLKRAKRKNKNVIYKKSDLNLNLDYIDRTFDKIAMIHVLYALKSPHFTLEELYRILKPNGKIVIANPHQNVSFYRFLKLNFKRIPWYLIPIFLFKITPLLLINLFIVKKGKSGEFFFWNREDWKRTLKKLDINNFVFHTAYEGEDLLVVISKEV